MPRLKHLFLISFLSFIQFGWSQNLTIINENDKQPIQGVLVETPSGFYKITNRNGEVNIDEIELNDTLFISHKSFQTQILLKANLPQNLIIELKRQDYYLPTVSVNTPPLRGYIDVHDEPHQVVTISKNDVLYEKPSTSADMLQSSGQVLVQKSQGGGGSPIMRGFEANKLLLVIDGVRMNNAIYRSGHLQNSITIDPTILEETEVIFGPSSVLYGSDALGGVIHFHTQNPLLADSTNWKTTSNVSVFYNTQTGTTGNVNLSVAQKKWGFLASASTAMFTDYKMGTNRYHGYADWGKDLNFVVNENGEDSMYVNTDPNLQKNVGYKQIDLLSKFYYQPTSKLNFTANFQYSQSTNINRYDKLNEYTDDVLKYAEWYYGPQKRLFASTKMGYKPEKKWLNAGSIILSFQRLDEDRISRKFQSNLKDYQLEDVFVSALNADMNLIIDSNQVLYYGLEIQDNRVNSNAYVQDVMTNETFGFQTRYPDGSNHYLSSGVYVEYKNHLNQKTIFTTGLRYTLVYANSTYQDTSFIKLPFEKVNFLAAAPSGNLGLIYQATKRTLLKPALSTGFRAPNIDDYGKVFEKKGNTVVPTNQLKPEYAINAEITGEHVFGQNDFVIGASVYYTYLFNAIVRADATLNGLDSVLYDGEWTNVQTNINTDQAQIYGLSAYFNWNIIKVLSFAGTYNYTRGIDLGQNVPLAHISPQFGKVELKYHNQQFKASVYSYYNLAKKAEDYGGSSDNLDQATVEGTPAWATLNFKFAYTGLKNLTFHFKAANLMDIHYRQFASAISAPGRNFMLGIKAAL
ncbi:MAG: TonB-dependent receptor plug domain-containing protein [Putridiphycobacter sp.]